MNSTMTPTLRILALLTGHGRRLLAAAAAAVSAELAAVALMATAAWLISRAAQRPEIAALAGAIVAVRALALSGVAWGLFAVSHPTTLPGAVPLADSLTGGRLAARGRRCCWTAVPGGQASRV